MRGPVTRLASLDLTRCFVAVGRRMSITLAAQDLCLTQSAVSRQVQALEESLGVQLLNRGYRSISFTPGVSDCSASPTVPSNSFRTLSKRWRATGSARL